jgi:hypothetical protein
LSLGEVLDVSFGLGRRLYPVLLVVVLITQAIPALLTIYSQTAGLTFLTSPIFFLGNMVVSMIFGSICLGATTLVISEHYLGRTETAIGAISRALGMVGRLVVVSLLSSLLIGLGLLLLIIPGIIALSGLMLASVVVVIESPPSATAALGRSWKLTRGFRLKLLAVMFLWVLVIGIPSMGLTAAFEVLTVAIGETAGVIIQSILVGILGILLYPFLYVMLTVMYYDLRVRKESLDLELLATALPER